VPQFSFLFLPSLSSSHFLTHLHEAHTRCPVLLDTMAPGGQHTVRRGQPVMAQPTRGLTKDQEVLLDSWLPLLRAREMAVRQAARQLGCSEGLVACAQDGSVEAGSAGLSAEPLSAPAERANKKPRIAG